MLCVDSLASAARTENIFVGSRLFFQKFGRPAMAYLHKKFKKLARSEDVATVATSSRVATTTSRSGQAEETRWDQMRPYETTKTGVMRQTMSPHETR